MHTRKVVLKLPSGSKPGRDKKIIDDSDSDDLPSTSQVEESDMEGSSDIEDGQPDELDDDNEMDVDGDNDDEEVDEDEDEDQDQEEQDQEEQDQEGYDEFEDYEENDFNSPEPSKLTARQRSKLDSEPSPMILPDLTVFDNPSARKKKVLSAEEQRIKRAELARRRKNLSERRLEEEKQDTLDKLLKKRAGRTKKDEPEEVRAQKSTQLMRRRNHPAFRSWTSNANGITYSFTSPSGP